MFTRTEVVAAAFVILPATIIVAAYGFDRVGLGIWAAGSLTAALAAAITVLTRLPHSPPARAEHFTMVIVFGAAAAYLLWREVPSLLPGGSGPDLTHHLMLVDYIERHGALVRDGGAWRQLGEMAQYTPGLHVLAVVTASLARVDGIFTVYPVIVFAVAMKLAFFVLCVMRMAPDQRLRVPMAMVGVAVLMYVPALTLSSFTHDSFLAQVVSELFAVTMLWALVAWTARPSIRVMLVFGVAGAASFLTWPLWIGPLLIALALTVSASTELTPIIRLQHITVAVLPIAVVGVLHTIGRTDAVAIVGTSGAVAPPPFTAVYWWLLLLAVTGLLLGMRHPSTRVMLWLSVGLVAQAGALWVVARSNGAATPYMAIKMAYLAVYPAALAVALAVASLVRVRWMLWTTAVIAVITATGVIRTLPPGKATVDADLYDAGLWARDHIPPECVDYLVANEYTAYWLHLAVLGNARMTERSGNNDLYLTEPAFARWIQDAPAPRYAVAKRSVLPAEIRERTHVLYERGDAVVIERVRPTPAPADGTCAASSPTAVP